MRAQKLIKKSEIDNNRNEIVSAIRVCADRLEAGDNGALTDVVFECARLANTVSTDLEQDLYNKNDEFLKEISSKI